MGVRIHEGKFLRIFLRDEDLIDLPIGSVASSIEDNLRDSILDRLSRGVYLGGSWKTKGYSFNKIKAYKLAESKKGARVTGRGKNQKLSIGGVVIDDDDWYWGGYDVTDKKMRWSNGRKIPVKGNFNIAEQNIMSQSGGQKHKKPLPIFIPGYKVWRTKYLGLTQTVNMKVDGSLWKNLDVNLNKTRGSNQFGSNMKIEILVKEPFHKISEIQNHFRNFLSVTRDEIEEAIKESGLDLTS